MLPVVALMGWSPCTCVFIILLYRPLRALRRPSAAYVARMHWSRLYSFVCARYCVRFARKSEEGVSCWVLGLDAGAVQETTVTDTLGCQTGLSGSFRRSTCI